MAAPAQNPGGPATNGSSHPFTCNTCQVAFRTGELQRTHMQSDWHRYNLKRRVASLPPLTSEIFAEKVLANKASAAATAARASFEKICPACSKTYYSENAYQNHLGSQKHKAQVASMHLRQGAGDDGETGSMISSTLSLGEPIDTASTVSAVGAAETQTDEEGIARAMQAASLEANGADVHSSQLSHTPSTTSKAPESHAGPADLTQCFFCNSPATDMERNLQHMSKHHGMFIPEKDYLVDLGGLLGHLHELIFELHECLYCHQVKHTASGIQTHMRDRGHCMIAYDTEEEMLEIGDYYDFRSTYSDPEGTDDEDEDEAEGSAVKLGARRATNTTIATRDGEEVAIADEDEDGWESDASSLSSVPTDEITAMPIDDHSHRYKTLDKHRHHSHNDPRPHRNRDGFHSHAHSMPHAVYHDEYEMHLPSGRTAGHRSLNKYYRQNLSNRQPATDRVQRGAIEARHDSDDEMEDASPSNQRDRGRQVISRSNRELGMTGVTDAKKREVRAVEKRTQKMEARAQRRYEWGNNRRSNFQKHYRDPLLQ